MSRDWGAGFLQDATGKMDRLWDFETELPGFSLRDCNASRRKVRGRVNPAHGKHPHSSAWISSQIPKLNIYIISRSNSGSCCRSPGHCWPAGRSAGWPDDPAGRLYGPSCPAGPHEPLGPLDSMLPFWDIGVEPLSGIRLPMFACRSDGQDIFVKSA